MKLLSFKNSFALFSVMMILGFFSLLSYQILSNINFSNKIDSIKFDYIQARIYLDRLANELINDKNLTLNDDRFSFEVYKENNSTYHLFINSNKNLVRVYKKVSK